MFFCSKTESNLQYRYIYSHFGNLSILEKQTQIQYLSLSSPNLCAGVNYLFFLIIITTIGYLLGLHKEIQIKT